MLQRSEKGLIEQIQRPALLIRPISQLPGVNYHTHTSRCCSTYIIITVAKIENNLKLVIWGPPPPTSHTCAHTRTHVLYTNTHADTHVLTSQHHPHQYFLPEPPGIFPDPPPSPGASCFWDWFHLFNDGCANDPSHMADGVTDTTTSQEWGLDGGLESESGWYWRGQDEIGGAQQKDEGSWRHHVRRRSLSFSNKQGHWMQNRN